MLYFDFPWRRGRMIDLDLGDGHPDLAGDGRDEAVQLAVELDILDHLAAEHLERAAVVVEPDPGDAGDQPVGDGRGDAAGQETVPPLPPPAADDVIALLDLGDEKRDVVGIVLQVGVQADDDVAAGVVEAGDQGRRLAEIFPQADDLDSGRRSSAGRSGPARSHPCCRRRRR